MPTTKLCGQDQAQPTWPPQPKLKKLKYIVGCRGVVQLGGPNPWYNLGGPAKVLSLYIY